MRRAVYQAINIDLIVQKVLRGQGIVPTGAFLAARRRQPGRTPTGACPDPAKAKALLAEPGIQHAFGDAGLREHRLPRERVPGGGGDAHPGGHPHAAFVADEPVLPRLSRARPPSSRIRLDADDRCLGDAERALPHLENRTAAARSNAGRYSNPSLDTLIDNIRVRPT